MFENISLIIPRTNIIIYRTITIIKIHIFVFHFENWVINYLMACSSILLLVFTLTNHVILAGYVPTITYAFRTLQTKDKTYFARLQTREIKVKLQRHVKCIVRCLPRKMIFSILILIHLVLINYTFLRLDMKWSGTNS
jgi:hypothetical protein